MNKHNTHKQIHFPLIQIMTQEEKKEIKNIINTVKQIHTPQELDFFKRAILVAYFIPKYCDEGYISFNTFINRIKEIHEVKDPYQAFLKAYGFNTGYKKYFFFGIPVELLEPTKYPIAKLEQELIRKKNKI